MSAQIGLTTATAPERGFVVRAPYSQVHIPALEADDHIIMRAKQLAAILRLMPVGDYSEQMILLARKLADDLVKEVRRCDGGQLLAGQLAELLLMIEGPDGACDILWLCQQIAKELDETIPRLLEEGSAV
ncbi:MAG: hypothetical protein JWL97_4339 [Gemmatimonadales bacterium]|nr:hypothetical protein [Gemmatimonadales bacterium]